MAFISVDVEASGPLPGFFDLLSIGAVAVEVADRAIRIAEGGFYVEIAPLHGRADPAAMRVNRLDLTRLAREGVPLPLAARRFADWTRSVSTDGPPVFVGYCANFDWAFVNDLFFRAEIDNPFGYKALDLRSMALGALDLPWEELRQERMLPLLGLTPLADAEAHHALADARHQAAMFKALTECAWRRSGRLAAC
ncbi:MAG: 3'-5' exoribonuclease [Planctomycetes bacterium]|nr:3'-5' exoribonuclease [Planctomycetota bacterium]MCC7171344.1 3'-5' exoribonuclease [Planctomycetota bacterium]